MQIVAITRGLSQSLSARRGWSRVRVVCAYPYARVHLYAPGSPVFAGTCTALQCGCEVGLTGFEPATSPTRTERATKLRHSPRGLA
jgi:hypothetical protein